MNAVVESIKDGEDCFMDWLMDLPFVIAFPIMIVSALLLLLVTLGLLGITVAGIVAIVRLASGLLS